MIDTQTPQEPVNPDTAFDEALSSAFADPAPTDPAPAPAPAAEAPDGELTIDGPAPAEDAPKPSEGEPPASPEGEPPAPTEGEPATPAEDAPKPSEGEPPAPTEGEPATPGKDEPPAPGVALTDEQFRQILAATTGQKAAPTEPEQPAEPEPVTLDSFMTDDERALVAKYEDEWSDVAKAEAIRRRAEMQFQQHQIYSEVAKALAPLTEVIREVKVKTHFDTIRQAHPDVDQVLPGLQAWVDQQPASLKGVFSQVLQGGTAEQVVDLVSAYKKTVSPAAAPVPPAQAGTPSAPSTTTVPPTAPAARPAPTAAAVAATAAVGMGKRTAVSPGSDSNDFDGALAEALGV